MSLPASAPSATTSIRIWQVTSRLRALNQMGHVTDKIELIVLGGHLE